MVYPWLLCHRLTIYVCIYFWTLCHFDDLYVIVVAVALYQALKLGCACPPTFFQITLGILSLLHFSMYILESVHLKSLWDFDWNHIELLCQTWKYVLWTSCYRKVNWPRAPDAVFWNPLLHLGQDHTSHGLLPSQGLEILKEIHSWEARKSIFVETSLDWMRPKDSPPNILSLFHLGSYYLPHSLASFSAFSHSSPNFFLSGIFLNKILAYLTLSLWLLLIGPELTQVVPRVVWESRQQDEGKELAHLLLGR